MKKEYKGRVIYNPSGKAGEYSYWAANFYVGCSNSCTYCYLKKGRGAKVLGGNKPELKKSLKSYDNALDIFKAELLINKIELQKHGLFFSFTTDPLLSETIGLTTAATEFCQLHNVPVKILSKCAEGMERFIEFATSSGWDCSRIALGATLTGCDELEPNADPNQWRINSLVRAKNHGFRTFASVEPVPVGMFDHALSVIKLSYPWIEQYKIGFESGKRYGKKETLDFVVECIAILETNNSNAKIYFKESIYRILGATLQSNVIVNREFNLFDSSKYKTLGSACENYGKEFCNDRDCNICDFKRVVIVNN